MGIFGKRAASAAFVAGVGLLVAAASGAYAQGGLYAQGGGSYSQGEGSQGSGSQSGDIARPGTVNYIEGAVMIDGNQLPPEADSPVAIDTGQVLSTAKGKAELLLTPGIFFRVNDQSAVKMISPKLTPTIVELEKGRAAVEVDAIFPANVVEVVVNGKATQLLKRGFYEFNADTGQVRVFDGEAAVLAGAADTKGIKIKGGKELIVASVAKPDGFDRDHARDELYRWSSLRSEYMAQADGQMAGDYESPGWYWNPYFGGYGFFGYPYWSPFGWGYGFYGGGYYRGGYYGGYRGGGYRGPVGGHVGGGFGGVGGGMHGGGGGHR